MAGSFERDRQIIETNLIAAYRVSKEGGKRLIAAQQPGSIRRKLLAALAKAA